MEQENMTELEPKEIVIEELEPLGFGNPESSISRKKQLENGELSPEVDAFAQEFIKSGKAIVSITEIDDGCIDGRKAVEITYRDENGELKTVILENDGHERAKVAGGGYITSQAMRLGVGIKGETAHEDTLKVGTDLSEKGIFCGAHTGPHTQAEGATDCGANDKMELILANGLNKETDENGEEIEGGQYLILAATKKLIETAGLTFNEDIFNKVIANWRAVLEDKNYFGRSSGKERLQAAIDVQQEASIKKGGPKPVAVTKNLRGDHKEDYIVVNYIKGKTFSQNLLQKELVNEFTKPEDENQDNPNLAQTFVVDAWRIVELAQAAVEEDDVETAIYAGVMYQIATAATLTDGTLKMFTVTEQKDVALAA